MIELHLMESLGTQQRTSTIVGDFKFEYRLSDDGKFRLVTSVET